MPYIEGPMMDWTVNDGLCHRFLKCHLKCENILECELAMLPERGKCKKVFAWSGDFGMDQYVSWNLSNEELVLDTIWKKIEEFCKLQWYEVGVRFDWLQASGKETSQLMNGTMQHTPRLLWQPAFGNGEVSSFPVCKTRNSQDTL